MGNIQLIRLDSTIERAFASDPEFMAALADDDWARVAELVHGRVGRTLIPAPISVNELHWGGYFVVDEDTREVIGSCAFKSSPTEDGTVEIAYFTYPGFERRGYATQMARKLIELANRSQDVTQIVAHTLPEASASTRVLEKSGMVLVGDVIDPEDGPVWRWSSPAARPAGARDLETLLEAFADAWNRHDVEALMSMMTEDGVFEASAGDNVNGERHQGQRAVRAAYEAVFAQYPDARWADARHFVNGNRGVSEWTFTGRMNDGRRVEVTGCDLFTFRSGKIAVKNSFRKNRPPIV